jgi:hypothetical protein
MRFSPFQPPRLRERGAARSAPNAASARIACARLSSADGFLRRQLPQEHGLHPPLSDHLARLTKASIANKLATGTYPAPFPYLVAIGREVARLGDI